MIVGLVTKDGFVKCTIKEFNDYRQWIRKLKLDALEQDWHLQKGNQVSADKLSRRSSDASQLTKQRQERARELYNQKQKKKEQERKR